MREMSIAGRQMAAEHFAKPRADEGGGELQAFLMPSARNVTAFRPLKPAAAWRHRQTFRVEIHHERLLTRLLEGKTVPLKQKLEDLFDLLNVFPPQHVQRAVDGPLA